MVTMLMIVLRVEDEVVISRMRSKTPHVEVAEGGERMLRGAVESYHRQSDALSRYQEQHPVGVAVHGILATCSTEDTWMRVQQLL